ncbi:hypothetical protein BOTCAL_0495g00090 [Botryotinia calthae]|uniref:Uncharacterized protein n=1 Tax=Botryotinia calthae TaxID=38488 RepID=A0A4Y8CNS5_9HELO|nr:hypothetical protein BOTCAL_0495g00090 [Botryotinia calthae]
MQKIRVEGGGGDERRGDEDAGYEAEDESTEERIMGRRSVVGGGREREGILQVMFCGCMTLTAEIPMLLLAMLYAAPILEGMIAQLQPMAPKKDCGVEGWLLDSRWEYEGGGD